MKNPLSTFTRWRLSSGTWFYSAIFAGWASMVCGGVLLLRWFSGAMSSVVSGEAVEQWHGYLGLGLVGLGIFVLVFEIGLMPLFDAARTGLPYRRVRNDPELWEDVLGWQKKDKDLRRKYG